MKNYKTYKHAWRITSGTPECLVNHALSSLNKFIKSGLGNKLLQLVIPFHFASSGISLLFLWNLQGFFNVPETLFSLSTCRPFIVPLRQTSIVSQDHSCKWCQGRAEDSFLKIFSPQQKPKQQLLCFYSDTQSTIPQLFSYCDNGHFTQSTYTMYIYLASMILKVLFRDYYNNGPQL